MSTAHSILEGSTGAPLRLRGSVPTEDDVVHTVMLTISCVFVTTFLVNVVVFPTVVFVSVILGAFRIVEFATLEPFTEVILLVAADVFVEVTLALATFTAAIALAVTFTAVIFPSGTSDELPAIVSGYVLFTTVVFVVQIVLFTIVSATLFTFLLSSLKVDTISHGIFRNCTLPFSLILKLQVASSLGRL